MTGLLIGLFVCHFLADFVFQTSDIASRKSKDWDALLQHCAHHAMVFMVFLSFVWGPTEATALLAGINAIAHGFIDRNVWREYRKYAARKQEEMVAAFEARTNRAAGEKSPVFNVYQDAWFWRTLGFDQLLHGSCLIALAGWLKP